MSDIWEPWRPQVGDRVRVHLSAECQFRYGYGNFTEHFPESDGAVGSIEEIDGCTPAEHDPSHRYCVRFRPSVPVNAGPAGPGSLLSHCFAAAELVPVDG
jgi:hypothetical protein